MAPCGIDQHVALGESAEGESEAQSYAELARSALPNPYQQRMRPVHEAACILILQALGG